MKFIVDKMLGKLCKWLRILGYDATYFVLSDRRLLVYKSLQENRIILTRDRRVSKKKSWGLVLIEGNFVDEQLKQVIQELKLEVEGKNIFSRCLICNISLEPIARSEAQDKVPPYIYQTQDRFVFCPQCRRVYWQGTHWERAKQQYANIRESLQKSIKT